MVELNNFQKKILQAMADRQELAVEIAAIQYKLDDNMKKILYDVTYECLIGVMTLIDGYVQYDIKLDIIDRNSGERLKENPFIELHDTLCEYLKSE